MNNKGQGNRLAIILINWEHSRETIRVISQIHSWNRLEPLIIVVDNGSSREERDLLQKEAQGAILVLNSLNRGFAGGNNDGINRALTEKCDYILLLNVDAEITEESVETLLSVLENNPDLGAIGPILREGGNLFAGGRDISRYAHTRILYENRGSNTPLIIVDYVPGTVFLVRGEVFKNVGLLSEDYFFSGEIADFCYRCRVGGRRCGVYTGCNALHHIEKGIRRDTIHPYYSLRNRFLYIRKNCKNSGILLLVRWLASGMLHTTVAYCLGNRQLASILYLAVKDGIRGVYGNQNERIKAACHHCNPQLEWNALA